MTNEERAAVRSITTQEPTMEAGNLTLSQFFGLDGLAKRQACERFAVRKLLDIAMAADWNCTRVHDGEENQIVTSPERAMECVFAVDESHMRFAKTIDGTRRVCVVFIVLGNSGPEVVADHSAFPAFCTEVMDPLFAWTENLPA